MTDTMRPLEDVRVLDLSRLLPGGLLTRKLADLGAEVVKIEPPGAGDPLRSVPPIVDGMGLVFRNVSRGKRSVCVGLSDPEDLAVIRALALAADVVVHSFRPGSLESGRLAPVGRTLTEVRETKPSIVVCSISGYGETGPLAHSAAHAHTIDSSAGLMSIDASASPPRIASKVALGVQAGALNGAIAVLAAVHAARRTGHGSAIDISCWDAAVDLLRDGLAEALATRSWGTGSADVYGPTHAVYRTSDDRFVFFASVERPLWSNFCRAVGRTDLEDHPGRREEWAVGAGDLDELEAALRRELAAIFATRTAAEWQELFDSSGVVGNIVNEVADLAEHPHLIARKMLSADRTAIGRAIHDPIRWADTDTRPGMGATPAPALGADTTDVTECWLPR